MTMRPIATALAVLLFAGPLLAEECPDKVPDDSVQRRVQAKAWFSKGEDSTKVNDDLGALKAYQCSLKFVPHGFTSFNIAQIAERVGDIELAIASYDQYLLLVPDAKDADEISQRAAALKQRLARVKEQERAARAAKSAATHPAVPLVADTDPHAEETIGSTATKDSTPYRTLAWVSYGSAAALVLGGVVTNLMSRGKMDSCRSKFNQSGDVSSAQPECDSAKPLAYTSYVLFGLGGAAAVVGTVLVLHPTESSEVAMAPLPEGGFSFRWGSSF